MLAEVSHKEGRICHWTTWRHEHPLLERNVVSKGQICQNCLGNRCFRGKKSIGKYLLEKLLWGISDKSSEVFSRCFLLSEVLRHFLHTHFASFPRNNNFEDFPRIYFSKEIPRTKSFLTRYRVTLDGKLFLVASKETLYYYNRYSWHFSD